MHWCETLITKISLCPSINGISLHKSSKQFQIVKFIHSPCHVTFISNNFLFLQNSVVILINSVSLLLLDNQGFTDLAEC